MYIKIWVCSMLDHFCTIISRYPDLLVIWVYEWPQVYMEAERLHKYFCMSLLRESFNLHPLTIVYIPTDGANSQTNK